MVNSNNLIKFEKRTKKLKKICSKLSRRITFESIVSKYWRLVEDSWGNIGCWEADDNPKESPKASQSSGFEIQFDFAMTRVNWIRTVYGYLINSLFKSVAAMNSFYRINEYRYKIQSCLVSVQSPCLLAIDRRPSFCYKLVTNAGDSWKYELRTLLSRHQRYTIRLLGWFKCDISSSKITSFNGSYWTM